MAIAQIIERLRKIKHDLTANREADALRIAFDTSALIKLRIQRSGENADGAKFSPYVPSYAASRKKAGYQVGYVDFTRTGQMWASVLPKVQSSGVFSATVTIESTNQRGRAIIAGAAPKRGNILRPSRREIELVRAANRERVRKYLGI